MPFRQTYKTNYFFYWIEDQNICITYNHASLIVISQKPSDYKYQDFILKWRIKNFDKSWMLKSNSISKKKTARILYFSCFSDVCEKSKTIHTNTLFE